MDSLENIDYEQVEEVLANVECETTAAEMQAILCGMLAAGVKQEDRNWMALLIDIVNDGRELADELRNIIEELFEWSRLQMNQNDSLTSMLLPDDSYPVADQLEALAAWCQGFLLGFGLQTGSRNIGNREIKEALSDIAEISQIELEAEENEETQVALFTLKEHIKVAVQVIFLEMVVKDTISDAHVFSETQVADNQTLH